jgi:hypothetical protein
MENIDRALLVPFVCAISDESSQLVMESKCHPNSYLAVRWFVLFFVLFLRFLVRLRVERSTKQIQQVSRLVLLSHDVRGFDAG